jgi:hypothetical protein
MIISIDTEKVFDMIQYLYIIKALNELGIVGMYFSKIMAIYDKPKVHFTLNEEKLRPISSDVRNEISTCSYST